jgi:hypothetical protein
VLDDALPPTLDERDPGAWIGGKLVLRVDGKGRRLSGHATARANTKP